MATGTLFTARLLLSVFVCCCSLVTLRSVRNVAEVTAAFQFPVDDKPAEEKPRAPEEIESKTRSASANVRRNATTIRPPLESIVDGWNITKDPQFLLDFAVLGFAKCGTSTMISWLGQHSEARCIQREVYDLLRNQPATLIRRLYNKLPEGDFKRGYKSPNEIGQAHVRARLSTYWPETGIMVGIRHPVTWFESFYNFRVNNLKDLPHASKLVGQCTREKKGVCTNRGLFHVELATLGKTNMSSPEELDMIQRYPKHLRQLPPPFTNRLFLFTTDQLADANETRTQLFAEDVQHFIGFTEKMPPMLHVKPGKEWNHTMQALKDSKKINICNSEYDAVRKVLMDIARPASVWIRKYFMESDQVVVSSPDYFKENLETWMHDPCDN